MSTPITQTTEMPSESSISENNTSRDAESSLGRSDGADSGVSTTTNGNSRTKTEAELAADRLYEELIEDEYAKREGGA